MMIVTYSTGYGVVGFLVVFSVQKNFEN